MLLNVLFKAFIWDERISMASYFLLLFLFKGDLRRQQGRKELDYCEIESMSDSDSGSVGVTEWLTDLLTKWLSACLCVRMRKQAR